MRKKTKVDFHVLSQKQVFWILASVIIAVSSHLPRLPIWFPLMLILVVISRWFTASKRMRPLPSFVIAFITIFIFLAIIYFQGFSLNREISVTILTTMTVLKLLETWKKRDAWMVVTLCYFVILTRFFYSQDMLLVFYLLGSVMVITHALYVLQHNNNKAYWQLSEIKQTLGLLLAGVPLAALFFLFFPRLGSPIWGSPDFFGEGVTGMSDEMSPGSISQLFSDDSTAFRVTFNGQTPPQSQLYWRGPVLWDFDGFTWTRNQKSQPSYRPHSFADQGLSVSYEVELEPTGQKYMFALDYLLFTPNESKLITDSQLMSQQKINQLRHYQATSIVKQYNPYELLSLQKLERLKKLPNNYNPATHELMQRWKKQKLGPEQLINQALLLFSQDEFYYSYSPPLLQGNTIDQFLFETKSGFCEHYASAFTYMMRAAGLPARVVTGYQGGIMNEGYLLVKQSDAHAWSEVWIKDKGWLRVDPTAAVSPLRVEKGSQALMSEKSRSWIDSSWYRKMGEKYDGMRHKWNKWVRDYNVIKQKALFEVFGFDSQDGKAIALVLGFIMIVSTLIVLLFLYLTRPKKIVMPYDKIYFKFIGLFVKKGVKKPEDQGIVAFSEKVVEQFPETRSMVSEFTQLYLKLRFSNPTNDRKALNAKLSGIVSSLSKKIKKIE